MGDEALQFPELKMRRFIQYTECLLLRGVIGFFSWLPRSFYSLLAPVVARVAYYIPGVGSLAMQNIAVVFPEKTKAENKKIIIKSFENVFLTMTDFFWVRKYKNCLSQWIDIAEEDRPFVEQVKARPGVGMVFLTPHAGNWELAGMGIPVVFGKTIVSVMRSPRNPYIGKMIMDDRIAPGVELIYSKGAARVLAHALKDGKSIGMLVDQNTRVRDGGTFVDFAGLKVPVSMVPAHFARKGDRLLISGIAMRENGKIIMHVKVPRKPVSEYASDEELTQEIMWINECIVREHPEQYMWCYKRFQYIPPDTPEEIKKKYPSYAVVPGERFFTRKR